MTAPTSLGASCTMTVTSTVAVNTSGGYIAGPNRAPQSSSATPSTMEATAAV